MSRRLRVMLDCDGVLAEFVSGTLDSLVHLGGPRLTANDIVEWDVLSAVPSEYRDPLFNEWLSKGWCENLHRYPFSRGAVDRLRLFADVHFLTAPFPGSQFWLQERTNWLDSHFEARQKEITFTHAKEFVWGDVLVDDKPEHVLEWAARHPEGLGVLWDQPYNQDVVKFPDNVVRECDWNDLVTMLKERAA